MNSDNQFESSESDINEEIQKTLICINDLTLKIKRELTEIHTIVQEKGQLDIAVTKANSILLKVAIAEDISIDKLLETNQDEPELQSNVLDDVESN